MDWLFFRKLPQITPRRVWDLVPTKTVWNSLLESFDPESGQMKVDEACNKLVAGLYSIKFCNHVKLHAPGLPGVLAALQRSKLSEKTKSQIPDFARVSTTVRNSNWVLHYWDCVQPVPSPLPSEEVSETSSVWDYSGCFPDPISQEFGFKASASRKNAVQWMDVD